MSVAFELDVTCVKMAGNGFTESMLSAASDFDGGFDTAWFDEACLKIAGSGFTASVALVTLADSVLGLFIT